jgi:hypothetical protein
MFLRSTRNILLTIYSFTHEFTRNVAQKEGETNLPVVLLGFREGFLLAYYLANCPMQ